MDAPLLACRKQALKRRLVEQAVAAREEEQVWIGLLKGAFAGFSQIDPEPPSLDDALLTQADERFRSPVHGRLEEVLPSGPMMVLGNVMDVDDVDLREPKPLVAVLDRTHRTIVAVVVLAPELEAVHKGRILGSIRLRA